MKLSILLFLSLLAMPLLARPATEKPNVIMIFLDDCGYGDFSHTGNPSIHTPNISRMVREGMNCPQFYCASPACTASRYALLTGRNPGRSGLGAWVLGPTAAKYIHPNEVTIPEGLKNQGYATAFFGKWHLGTPNSNNSMTASAFPLAHGFDTWEGTNVSNDYETGSDLIKSNPSGNTPIAGYEMIAEDILNKTDIHDNLTKRYRDRTVEFIQANKDQPFFVYLAPNMPHLPVHASDEFKDTSLRGLYGDCIEEIDAMVGTILSTLENEGIAQNTLVIFTSDNGPWIRFQNTASNSRYGEARILIGSALPFRDGKGSTWEGGVRVPGVFYWPGTIPAATVVREPVSTMDILPTVFKLAGEAVPTDRTLDGRDIRPLLNSALFQGTVPDFEFIYTGASNNQVYGARKGAWKLHTKLYSQTGNNYGFSASFSDPLLFNVEQDPHERFDRSDDETTTVNELKQMITDFNNSVSTEGTFWNP
ncbi:N-acetylgalactosamine-6-O-sulfatase [Rubritalea halochordaticola]|uniref:N-acetylgalactosamine-6-O-sulfatase n=1 Tax=Rubritalea halochordaticola TaxID=714537 RepID=A0ABP9V1M9_9BACT